jgi:hypothetical protein
MWRGVRMIKYTQANKHKGRLLVRTQKWIHDKDE